MATSYYNIQFVNYSGDVLDDLSITVSYITEERIEAEAVSILQHCTESEQADVAGFYVTGVSEQTLGKCWYCRIERVVSVKVTRV